MIRIAICDDEVTTLHQTHTAVRQYFEQTRLSFAIETFGSGEALIAAVERYEIILLDIDMSGLNGIETAKKIRERDKQVKIIYLTNYSDYTTFAFSVHAFAYLLKPLNVAELHRQFDEAFEYMAEPMGCTLAFQTQDGLVRLNAHGVLYLEYLNRKVHLHVKDIEGRGDGVNGVAKDKVTHVLNRRMSDLEEALCEKGFAMPHKSFIVNLYAVKAIKNYDIYLVDGSIIPLSQKKSVAFRTALNMYLSQGRG